MLQDIHSRICGNQVGTHAFVGKTTYMQAGVHWPTAVSDADSLVHRCKEC
jgi:hypothetical protein